MCYYFRLTARVILYALSHRQDSTYHDLYYTSRGALPGTRNSSMGPPHEGSTDNPSHHERTHLPLFTVMIKSFQFVDSVVQLNSEHVTRTCPCVRSCVRACVCVFDDVIIIILISELIQHRAKKRRKKAL